MWNGNSLVWDLDSLFPGYSNSPQLQERLRKFESELAVAAKSAADQHTMADSELTDFIQRIQGLLQDYQDLQSIVDCLLAQDVDDLQAKLIQGRLNAATAELDSLEVHLQEYLARLSEERWQQLCAQTKIGEISFALSELRRAAQDQLPREQEILANSLAVDGYHAWLRLYDTIVGRMELTLTRGDHEETVSIGQARYSFSDPDRVFRQQVFAKFEQAWAEQAEIFAQILNHISGFRLNLYKKRGWNSVLHEPLRTNRLSVSALEAMWQAVANGREVLGQYLWRKAKLLNIEQLAWFDLEAPLGEASRQYTFGEAAQLVIASFARYSEDLANLASRAIEERWVEAENRRGKLPGAFCTPFPGFKQSRVFMTFTGSLQGVWTLAHELGHAYHGEVLKDLPGFSQEYPMSLAETASTLAETMVMDAALEQTNDYHQKLLLLDQKAQNAVALLMDIQSRFLFETRFYEQRKTGELSATELNDLMISAQEEAFGHSLAQYHPYFWASKEHFYLTDQPFYNFPYTFGYLFSSGIYARFKEEGPAFAAKYHRLLADTGRMGVEELALRHLGVDLTKPHFWQEAVQTVLTDVRRFLELTR